VTGLGVYADGMVEHDKMVGQLLAKLKELGFDENTIVMYATDNGNEFLDWPDGGTSYFRGEKNSQWEGGFRIPAMIKWPGVIKPGTINNEICSLEDMVPTIMAAVGNSNIKEELLKGKQIGNTTYKVHLDGYNLLPMLKNGGESPRKEFIYWTDGGSVAALRYGNWKITFLRQDATGLHTWIEPFTELRAPMIANLRMDPFERAQDEASGYGNWYFTHMFAFAPAATYVGQWLQSFKEFPPRMKPGSFSLDRVMEAVTSGWKSN
jgi:arylsulfatase